MEHRRIAKKILTYNPVLTHGAEPFFRSCPLCSYSRTSHHFMEPEGSLPCSQEPSTCPHAEPDYNPIRRRNVWRPQLRWREEYSLQEDGTDRPWPNPKSSRRRGSDLTVIVNCQGDREPRTMRNFTLFTTHYCADQTNWRWERRHMRKVRNAYILVGNTKWKMSLG
jgi:hypothetical protein